MKLLDNFDLTNRVFFNTGYNQIRTEAHQNCIPSEFLEIVSQFPKYKTLQTKPQSQQQQQHEYP